MQFVFDLDRIQDSWRIATHRCTKSYATGVPRFQLTHGSQVDGPTKELSNHIQSLWDQYFTEPLNVYTLNGNNVDIDGFLCLPPTWHRRRDWLSLTSRNSQHIQGPMLDIRPCWSMGS